MDHKLPQLIKLAFFTSLLGLNLTACYQPKSQELESPSTTIPEPVTNQSNQENLSSSRSPKTTEEIYEDANPSVVLIKTGSGLGSGFFVQENGIILTNAHVLGNARFPVQVVTADGTELIADLIAFHPDGADLAAIKIRRGSDFPPLSFGDEQSVKVGQAVYAIGSPLGNRNTFTNGIVSRTLPEDDLIQHNAAINPGNSGGPLLNSRGEVIGINTFIESVKGGSDGLAFAISADIFVPFLQDVQELETAVNPLPPTNRRSQPNLEQAPEPIVPRASQRKSIVATFEPGDLRLPNGSYFHPYLIEGKAGQTIEIEMMSEQINPALILVERNSKQLIQQNDDISRRNWNARIETRLPADGQYVIFALTYDAEATGNYQLSVLLDR